MREPEAELVRWARGETRALEPRRLSDARGDVPARCATAVCRRSQGARAALARVSTCRSRLQCSSPGCGSAL